MDFEIGRNDTEKQENDTSNGVHKKSRKQRKMMDTSRWKFPNFKEESKIENLSRDKEIKAEKINAMIERIKLEGIFDSVPEDELGVENNTENKGRITAKKKLAAAASMSFEFEENVTFPGNMYSNLLDRIESKEKDTKFLDADALARQEIENRFDNLAEDFSKWTNCFNLPEDSHHRDSLTETEQVSRPAIEASELRKLFEIDLCKPTICPYIPPIVDEVQERKKVFGMPKTKQLSEANREKQMKKMRQAYYLPPNRWFSSEDTANDKQELSAEQEQFIQSFGVQSFLRFLKDEGKEQPKFPSEMLQRHKDHLHRIKEAEKIEDQKKHPKC